MLATWSPNWMRVLGSPPPAYVASLNFTDSRNSGYVALLFEDF